MASGSMNLTVALPVTQGLPVPVFRPGTDQRRNSFLREILGASISWSIDQGLALLDRPQDASAIAGGSSATTAICDSRVLRELRTLAVCAARGLDDVVASGISATQSLEELRENFSAANPDTLPDEVNALCEPILENINTAVASKVFSLETEAVHIDELLQVSLGANTGRNCNEILLL